MPTCYRLDGKKKKEIPTSSKTAVKVAYQRGVPDYSYKIGTLRFLRNSRPPSKEVNKALSTFVFHLTCSYT
jgi:ubiquitin fusion degradation protein 1